MVHRGHGGRYSEIPSTKPQAPEQADEMSSVEGVEIPKRRTPRSGQKFQIVFVRVDVWVGLSGRDFSEGLVRGRWPRLRVGAARWADSKLRRLKREFSGRRGAPTLPAGARFGRPLARVCRGRVEDHDGSQFLVRDSVLELLLRPRDSSPQLVCYKDR